MSMARSMVNHMNTKLFWKTYFGDTDYIIPKAITGLLLALFWIAITTSFKMAGEFAIGWFIADPFAYYFIRYKKRLHETKMVK